MSRSKTLIVMGNAFAALETLVAGFIIFGLQVPGIYATAYSEGNLTDAYSAILITGIPFVLCLVGQIVNWVGLTKIDGINRQRWTMWFLVIGILTLAVNPISGILYIVAFTYANREQRSPSPAGVNGSLGNATLAKMPRINDWTLQSNLEDLRDWRVLSDTEAMSVRNELQI
ncbi:MAG: hypothetical protein LKJ47_03295 [Bifidobacteriaceae bacterium]|jgi:hypothetical protein|nr:hypothetical protein [Bifidobacteriaceae bacterium]